MCRRREAAAKQECRNYKDWLEMIDRRRCENGGRWWTDDALRRLPNARQARHECYEKIDYIENHREPDDPWIRNYIEAGRKMRDPTLALRDAKDSDGSWNVDPRRIRDAKGLREYPERIHRTSAGRLRARRDVARLTADRAVEHSAKTVQP